MEEKFLDAFEIIGISVRTTNESNQAMTDIGGLWEKFMSENIIEKIPNKLSTELHSIYTEYESDYRGAYTTVLGCKVEKGVNPPEGLVKIAIPSGKYAEFTAKGDVTKGAVYETWNMIWNSDLDRKYTADFEIYGEKAQNPKDAEIEIFVAINS